MIILGKTDKHTILISEKQQRELRLLNEHMDVVNNFNLAKRIISETWENPDDFWYVSITQRMKDNFNVRDDSGREIFRQKKFAGTSYKVNHIGYAIIKGDTKQDAINSLFNTTVHILPQWINTVGSDTVSGIIDVCEMMNARAYMKSQKKNLNDEITASRMFKPNGVTPKDIKALCGRNDNESVQVIMNYRMNRSDKNGNMALVDCDIDDNESLNKVFSILKSFKIVPYETTSSHNGFHILFDKRQISTNNSEIKNVIAKLNQCFNEEFGDYTNKIKRTNGMKRGQESQVEIGSHSNILLYSSAGDKSKNVTSPQWNKGKVYPYPEQRINRGLKENRSIIEEGLSDILYHFTTIKVLDSIVKSNSMICSSVYSNTKDQLIGKKYPFYISFTRQHNNNFGYVAYMNGNGNKTLSSRLNVRIEFDGRLLNSTYKGDAVNYHNIENPKNKQQQWANGDTLKLVQIRQSEDRLYSDSPVIPNIDKYIVRIDVLVPNENTRFTTLETLGKILKNSKFKDKVFIYEDEKNFNIPNCRNIINDKILNYLNTTSYSKYIVGNADNKEFINSYKPTLGRPKSHYLTNNMLISIGAFISILGLNQKRLGLKEYANFALNYMLQDYKNTIGKIEYNKEFGFTLKNILKLMNSPEALKNFSFNFFGGTLNGNFRIIYARGMSLLHDILKNTNGINFSTLKTNAAKQIKAY